MGTSFWEWTWSSEGGAVASPEIFLKNFFEIALLRMIVCYSTEQPKSLTLSIQKLWLDGELEPPAYGLPVDCSINTAADR